MRRGLLIILLMIVLVVGAGVVFLGLYPPTPAPKPVERVLPNDKFQTH